MLLERGLTVDQSTINRWVMTYTSAVERCLRQFRRPHCGSARRWNIHQGLWRWRYYRAVDKHGEAVDFLLTANRDLDAAKWATLPQVAGRPHQKLGRPSRGCFSEPGQSGFAT